MTPRSRPTLTVGSAALACLLALGSQSSVEASGSTPVGTRCYADWSQAAPIVRRESLVATAELHQHARTRKLGDLVRITLCEEGGRYVYRLVVLEPTNRTLTQHVVDARQPF